MRLKPPRVAEILAAAFGALLLVSLLLPWYREEVVCIQVVGADCPASRSGDTAFEAFAALDVYLLLVALAGLALLALEMTQRAPAIPVALSALGAPLALVATALVLWRVLDPPAEGVEPLFALLGLISSAGLAMAFALSMRNEGLDRRRPSASRSGGGFTLPEPLSVPTARSEDSRGEAR